MTKFLIGLAVVMLLTPAVYTRVLKGWPAAVEDFQDHPDIEEPVHMRQQVEERNMDFPSEDVEMKQIDNESARSNNYNQGYYKDIGPKSIILDDNHSIEARFAFPDFPKFSFPFDEPHFAGEKKF